jgi:hypothetical protein
MKRQEDKTKKPREKKLKRHVLTRTKPARPDEEIKEMEAPRKKRNRRKKRKIEFGLNIETLSLNARQSVGPLGLVCTEVPLEIFNGKYRKPGSDISR